MIKIDGSDHRHVSIGHIGGVPCSSEPHFDDRNVNRSVSEGGERHGRDDLEECHLTRRRWVVVNDRRVRLDLPPHFVESLVADRLDR